ncbi:uncharacterized protein V6R79_007080, partial [Siganus canaliculatus]
MSNIADFIACPSEDLLNACTREQLVQLAEHYGVDVGDKRLKDRMKSILRTVLFEKQVLTEAARSAVPSPAASKVPVVSSNLTFEQQKELLLLQLEYDKFKLKTETEKDLALEKLKQETQQAKLELEQQKLQLISEGKLQDPAADVSENTSSVVAPVPLVRAEPDDSEHNFPETFPACAVTRAMAAASTDTDPTLTP